MPVGSRSGAAFQQNGQVGAHACGAELVVGDSYGARSWLPERNSCPEAVLKASSHQALVAVRRGTASGPPC